MNLNRDIIFYTKFKELKMKGRILISLLLCFVLIISAFSFLGCSESNSEGYILSDDGTYYTFTGIKNLAETEYTFLSEIDGIPVTQIKANAFSQNFTIKKVIIPDSITKMLLANVLNSPK